MTDPQEQHLKLIKARAELGMPQSRDLIRADALALVAALRAVLDLHQPDSIGDCKDCSVDEHWTTYPCPTVTAINEALGGAQ